ncbi:hypothetical protein Tco_1017654 [Tanacetum coccineum]|uniref:Integrase, catalytic region, zinc finger, CCHC-type, peptidase aspartic, catalytic n=1 Tax=Tanacetum coccineum TaxID=301880 RepID=A0ABQ5FSI6_9ASTR
MHVMVAMVIRMQGDKAGIKSLMKEMEMMTTIRLFNVFHELSQLQEREQMLLDMKDEAGSNLNNEENDFMLDTSYGEETMEELTAAVMLMVRIQPADGNAETMPSYDAKVVSEVNASSKIHEQMRHEKRKTIIQTYDDDQIDSNIIFDVLFILSEADFDRANLDAINHNDVIPNQAVVTSRYLLQTIQTQLRNSQTLEQQAALSRWKSVTYNQYNGGKFYFATGTSLKQRASKHTTQEELRVFHCRQIQELQRSRPHRLSFTPNAAYIKTVDLDAHDLDCDERATLPKLLSWRIYSFMRSRCSPLSAIVIPDSKETLILAEESCSKRLLKQQDPMVLEKKVITTPVDYTNFMNSLDPNSSCRPTKIKVPNELPKVSMEKDLVITTLKNELRKLKGKDLADNVVSEHPVAPEILKVDVESIAPKLLNNRTAHSYYLKHTQKQAAILREVVEQEKSQNPLNNPLDSAFKSSLKNKNCFVEPKGNANVQHSKLNANSELLCVKCNGCMLSDNHDLCVLDFINDVNAHVKSKSRPTGWTFTIVGNACPLTRITTTVEVPLRKPTALESDTPKPVVTLVYSRKPRKSKTNVPVTKSKIIKSISANTKEPSQSWGSIVSDVPSSSLDECRLSKLFFVKFENDHMEKILGYGDYQIGNVTISRVYYVEGLRHNLFSIGQFCDSNLEVSFHQHTCFIRNLEGVDLLTGSRGNNL